jgi:hypothetical protein
MHRHERNYLATMLIASLAFTACTGSDNSAAPAATVAGKPTPTVGDTGVTSPGKPTAPISIKYDVVGNPIVGQPVLVNIEVRSAQGPVTVHYSITDTSALMLQEGQVERLEIADPSSGNVQQLSVIPQREGRVYVNVSAEVETPGGSMIRSMAVPIKVGAAPEQPTINGELKEGPDGETVISMPAQQTN